MHWKGEPFQAEETARPETECRIQTVSISVVGTQSAMRGKGVVGGRAGVLLQV